MKVETKTERTHDIDISAEDGKTFEFATADGTTYACDGFLVSLTVDSADNLRPMQTSFFALARRINKDGAPSSRTTRMDGHNLNRLPAEVLEAVLVESERLGVKGLREDLAKIENPHIQHSDA